MCGIVGYVGSRSALPIVISGLTALEYRGYDSAGVAVYENNEVWIARATGKLSELKKALGDKETTSKGQLAIGHTRWATHGRPTETNAHPHTAGRISLIHNGIVENYRELRDELTKHGKKFLSETDTEVAAHLMNYYLEQGQEPFDALKSMCGRVRGSYAFLAIDVKNPDRILIAKNSTPIIIGCGEKENFVASDIPAVLPYTRRVIILEDGDVAEVKADKITIENGGKVTSRTEQKITWDPVTAQKGGYKHFMLKEIHDQGRVITDTLRGRIDMTSSKVILPELDAFAKKSKEIERVVLTACGTAWHACLMGKFYIEQFAGIPCEVDYASELRYRPRLENDRTLFIAVSQSGETLDTLGAVEAVAQKSPVLAVCNVLGSSITRKASYVLYTHAGPEISVASTKAFTTQLITLNLFSLWLAQQRGSGTQPDARIASDQILHIPKAIEEALSLEKEVADVSKKFYQARDFLFLGRGNAYPIALEGALKLKEISYIHAEGYPAGEMKHGPIALIDENMPVVVVLQRSKSLFEKSLSNLKEVEARGGRVLVVTDAPIDQEIAAAAEGVIEVPYVSDELSPILLNIPLQFLAYHVAVLNGTDVDLPRNLAKSVTVE